MPSPSSIFSSSSSSSSSSSLSHSYSSPYLSPSIITKLESIYNHYLSLQPNNKDENNNKLSFSSFLSLLNHSGEKELTENQLFSILSPLFPSSSPESIFIDFPLFVHLFSQNLSFSPFKPINNSIPFQHKEIEEIKTLFKKILKNKQKNKENNENSTNNNNNSIDAESLRKVFVSIDSNISMDEIDEIIKEFDNSGTGEINITDFFNALLP